MRGDEEDGAEEAGAEDGAQEDGEEEDGAQPGEGASWSLSAEGEGDSHHFVVHLEKPSPKLSSGENARLGCRRLPAAV